MTVTRAQSLARAVLYQYDGDLTQSREALETRKANAKPDWPMSPTTFTEALSILESERAKIAQSPDYRRCRACGSLLLEG